MISCCLRLMIWQSIMVHSQCSIMVHSQCCMWISSVMWTVLVSHCPERTTKHLLILQKHNLNKKPCLNIILNLCRFYISLQFAIWFIIIVIQIPPSILSMENPIRPWESRERPEDPSHWLSGLDVQGNVSIALPIINCQGQGDISILNLKECFLTFGANWACACSYSVLS